MRADGVLGGLFYHANNESDQPPPVSDASWTLDDGGQWKSQVEFPVYGIPGMLGSMLINKLGQYSGNMSSAPFGNELTALYNPNDTVRLYARMNLSSSNGIPSLWVFLVIVLAILLTVVLATSVIMHLVQRKQRQNLQRRVAAGQVNLEVLGIKRLNVPQQLLDKMPQYLYTAPTDVDTNDTATLATATGIAAKKNNGGAENAAEHRTVPFSQPICPICLDDFVSGETTVRELPCNHIFHPECIDPFMRDNSSLCPMCKKSALPVGYCPVEVTNVMVRRERLIRRMRQRQVTEAGPQSHTSTGHASGTMASLRRNAQRLSAPPPSGPGPYSSANGTHESGAELQAMGNRRQTLVNEEMPPEIRAQGTSARRAWRRDRLAQREAQTYDTNADQARVADVSRPLCKLSLDSSTKILY
jgi:hypothetical protein